MNFFNDPPVGVIILHQNIRRHSYIAARSAALDRRAGPGYTKR